MRETDEQLYERFRISGDREALGEVVDRYADRLTLFLFGIVHQHEDAEELMMDTFAEVAALRSPFYGDSGFKAWLYTIAKHKAFMLLRRKHRFLFIPLHDEIPDAVDPPDMVLLRDERNRKLYQALGQLKLEYREALYLMYFEDMSNEELRRVMGKSAKQVYNLLNRGRASLREHLERIGFDEI